MSWHNKKFIDFILLQRGHDLTKGQIIPGIYPVVTSTSIMGYHNTYKANGPGVVTGRSGTIGEVQYITENYWPHNTSLYVKDFKGNHPKFVYYFMKNFGTGRAKNGSSVPTLNRNNLSGIDVKVPDYEIQVRIADILSSYDDLIENNQKQIKLLEEAAQRLYKEWFLDLHFPGYEDVKIVDGVPEGWKIHPIDDVFQIKYGKTLPTSKISSEGKYPVYGANGIIGFYSEKNIDDYVVLITSRGNGSGDVLITHDKESFVTNNSFIVKPINHNVRLPFIHQLMKCTGFKNICTGSAQPQLTNKSISTLCVLMPSYDLISRFCETESVWYEKIEKLLTQNKLLNQARDRILPKLMSGEIEV